MRKRQKHEEKPQKNSGPLRVWWTTSDWPGSWFTSSVEFDRFHAFLFRQRLRGQYKDGRGAICLVGQEPFPTAPVFEAYPSKELSLDDLPFTGDPVS